MPSLRCPENKFVIRDCGPTQLDLIQGAISNGKMLDPFPFLIRTGEKMRFIANISRKPVLHLHGSSTLRTLFSICFKFFASFQIL